MMKLQNHFQIIIIAMTALTQANLEAYLRSAFGEFSLPPLQQFLNNFSAESPIPLRITQEVPLEGDSVIFLQSGFVEIHRVYKQESKEQWRKESQIKEGGLFTLIDLRSLALEEAEYLRIFGKGVCSFGVLEINKEFGYRWLRSERNKSRILARVLSNGSNGPEAERKKGRFKQLACKFNRQIYKRGTTIIAEGHTNQKLFLVAEGSVSLSKSMSFPFQKQITILSMGAGALIGAQFLLNDSKTARLLVRDNLGKTEKHGEQENEGGGSMATKNYVLYSLSENISNFTVTAESAQVQIYFIEVNLLLSGMIDKWRRSLFSHFEQRYITLLKRTAEKVASVVSTPQGFASEGPLMSERSQSWRELKKEEQKKAMLRNEEYKERIERLLQQKLQMTKQQNYKQTKQFVGDLQEIFEKTGQNQLEELVKQKTILSCKEQLISRRHASQQPNILLQGQCFDTTTNKTYRINLLRRESGLKIKGVRKMVNYLAEFDTVKFVDKTKKALSKKIYETNKIRQQFLKICSECQDCRCYDHSNRLNSESLSRSGNTSSRITRTKWRTPVNPQEEESLEKVYNQMKFLSPKTKERYDHKEHLRDSRRNHHRIERRSSAPLL